MHRLETELNILLDLEEKIRASFEAGNISTRTMRGIDSLIKDVCTDLAEAIDASKEANRG